MPSSHRPPDTTRQSSLRRVWRGGVNWTIAINMPRLSGVFRGGGTGRWPPLWPEHKNFLNTLNQKIFLKFLGRGHSPLPRPLLQWGGDTPLPTLYPIGASGASNLASLALLPPSQNPKYATAQTSNFPSATVSSCRESNSHRRSGRNTDKTVLSCLPWRCELALSPRRNVFGSCSNSSHCYCPAAVNDGNPQHNPRSLRPTGNQSSFLE